MSSAPAPPRTEQPRTARLALSRQSNRSVRLMDRTAAVLIRGGGILVIAAVAAIFLFIGKEAAPLFLPARATAQPPVALPPAVAQSGTPFLGMDEYESHVYWLDAQAGIGLASLPGWHLRPPLALPELSEHTVSAAYRSPSHDYVFLGSTRGHVCVAQVKFQAVFEAAGRRVQPHLAAGGWIEVSPAGQSIQKIFGRHGSDGKVMFAAVTADRAVYVGQWEEGEDPKVERVEGLPEGEITHLVVDGMGEKLFVGLAGGRLCHYYLQDSTERPLAVLEVGNASRRVTAVELLTGDHSLLLGFSDGSLEQWFAVREQQGQPLQLRKIRSFESLPGPVTHLVPSSRDRGFLAASAQGVIRQCFTTSVRTLVTLSAGEPLQGLVYSPKLSGVLATTPAGQARQWSVRSPHPEISWQTLFGKVWYEGYEKPAYVWQSTGGTDDFEPKISLVPLSFGTLKGAIYGLLFAVPLAVMAAIYVSQFMHHRLRGVVKPAVEIMAALPSVVIGFLAGLWLAPRLESQVLSLLSLVVVVPGLVLGAVLLWNRVPRAARHRLPAWTELALISGVVLAAVLVSMQVGPWLEARLFGGDLRQWLFSATGRQFEQRNSVVIGFALGFAVIPIIFTISEDALSNVPQHFISGSLALGASRWQTALRIIVPTASPGIFSAIMVGFGRAVGETMIVLMATGNTPILDWSPFNGMRTLSANIAVEIPEAPLGGTLYRVLFLTAILLFLMTFLVNTVAELIRDRLREKYKAV